jgi:hypothetical protein
MNTSFIRTTDDRDAFAQMNTKPSRLRRIVRALKLPILIVLGGILLGFSILWTTNMFRLIPPDGPMIWVKSGCGAAEAAVRAAQHAEPGRPVFLIPLDQNSETTKAACHETLTELSHDGRWWLQYFPESWLCQRFAEHATEHLGAPIPVPRFSVGAQKICDGLCESAFERIGRPELQQFVTFIKPGGAKVPDSQ